ncbi:alkaline phosphatase D family protein [Aquimarina sp. 2201CG14-23]|uniref:alkaline phosphatase D family protein n=1 Tax=Aquimarina mycalae TaxID=3040073 RepID=UPI002477D9E7|nr:alkaline phosphatase D family protein [Aquimarina sp. 2201CG14-23]MDH7444271.1 alkaline phosphatase D family protein [Aquimarina sp. 2201CG14-23]
MKTVINIFIALFFATYYSFSQTISNIKKPDFTIAFGSCNKQNSPQPFWKEILKNNPDVFIWGGDNIYGDSDDMSKIANDYKIQNKNSGYQKLKKTIPILATWDDHDYGKNDVGAEWSMKEESQQLFLDFLGVSKDDYRRKQEGVYYSKLFKNEKGSINVIILDTRYFRSKLLKDVTGNKRYVPYKNNIGTILGEKQWKWLEKELDLTTADFNVIVSSIQFLSSEHGWECWGNFPGEVERLKKLIVDKKVKNAMILSGDRHISEFSTTRIPELRYPLVDFTSSGLTHSYSKYSGEVNKNRVGVVISVPSFGVLKFNFDKQKVIMQMRGENNKILQEFVPNYHKN